jgi:hypothetical protein
MTRTLIGAAVGGLLGILALATYGAAEGLIHGGEFIGKPSLAAGPYAAFLSALILVAYLWWLAGGGGAWIGGLIGLGAAAVRRWIQETKKV